MRILLVKVTEYLPRSIPASVVNKQNPERYETLVNKAQENVNEKRSLLEHMAEFKVAE